MDPFNVDPRINRVPTAVASTSTSTPTVIDDPYGIEVPIVYTADQQAMLALHPWVLMASVGIIIFGSLYAGLVSPVLVSFFGRLDKGYAHGSRWSLIAFCAFVGIASMIGIIYTWLVVDGDLDFVSFIWKYSDYWSWNERLIMPGYLFWYIYGSFFFNLVMCSIFGIVARWDKISDQIVQTSERHGFIIVAHNSSDKLSGPIEAILKFAKPHQIFIADNGSCDEEITKTKALCDTFTQGTSRVNVAHLRYGNKTLAQYACVTELVRRLQVGTSSIDIVTLIDDDVFIPSTFSGPSLEQQFEDESKVAIAYPLRIANPDASAYATLQDAEYFTGNVARYVQDTLGTQLFASGAVATWKLQPLERILERHCTAFNGEDLEMGVLLHKLCDASTGKLGVNGGVRIGFDRGCVVPTTVPVCVSHWYDYLPAPLRRKLGIKACDCGEASFFNQRVRSWDPACHAYIWKFLKVVFSPRGTSYGPKVFIRVLCLWKLLSILREYLLVVGIVWSFIRIKSVDMLVDLCIFYIDSIVVSWACGILVTWTQSASVARQGLAMRPDVTVTYPLLLELPYGLIIRPISVIYTFTYYLFFQRAPSSLRKQLATDPEKAQAIQDTWRV